MAASSASGGSRCPEPGVGTVAEEAARLVDLLSGYTATAASGASSSSSSSSSSRDGTAGRGSPSAEGHADADHGSGPQEEVPGSVGGSAQCSCGGPAACRSCPLCQLIAFVQRVDPNAIDRLAEFVELAATGLRDLATVQRGRREQDRPEGPAGQ